jgi:4-oxalocrotonate tautomerase
LPVTSGVSVKDRGVPIISSRATSAKSRPTVRGIGPDRRRETNATRQREVIEGVFNEQQKRMVADITNAMVAIEGETMRQVTWGFIEEIKSGNFAIGGKPLSTADVKALQAGRSAA